MSYHYLIPPYTFQAPFKIDPMPAVKKNVIMTGGSKIDQPTRFQLRGRHAHEPSQTPEILFQAGNACCAARSCCTVQQRCQTLSKLWPHTESYHSPRVGRQNTTLVRGTSTAGPSRATKPLSNLKNYFVRAGRFGSVRWAPRTSTIMKPSACASTHSSAVPLSHLLGGCSPR